MSDPQESLALPTVGELLGYPEFLAGEPEVIATERALAVAVRWAHVVAGTSASALLDGGELVLTTGAGWPQHGAPLRELAESLVHAGVSAIVLELGATFHEVPRELREVATEHDVALVVLHREVRFVQITQRVHRRILAAQHEALQAREEVHRMFTELGLNRSPVDYMVEQMAATLQAPVVLENTAGHVVAFASPDAGSDAEELLAAWANRPSGVTDRLPDCGDLERVSVEAQGVRWGTLTALPGPPHPAGRRTVLELGAITLALARLSDPDGDEWLRLSAKRLFDALLDGRYRSEASLAAQLAAGGLPIEQRVLLGVSLTGIDDFGSHHSLERAVLETALRRAVAPEGRAIITDTRQATGEALPEHGSVALIALLSFADSDVRLESATAFAMRLARELDMLVPTTTPAQWRAHLALGVPSTGVRGLISSIEGVLTAGMVEAVATVGRVSVQQEAKQPLAYLVRGFADTPEMQEFVQQVLGPLLAHDAATGPGHTGDLIEVLAAVLSHPTNRSLAAQQARLSRSVLYQRIALIEELLGVDLTAGDTIATLAVALAAHRR